jgi:REP element-mobilizing transposase RayT
MPNHFHFLLRIKEVEEINKKELPIPVRANSVRVNNPDRVAANGVEAEVKSPHLYFSHLFNAYTQAFNKYSSRHGNLFERPFKRIIVKDESYFKQLILYIHNNPVKHGFTSTAGEYTWSSYNEIISSKPTNISRDKTIGLFNDRSNFIFCHRKIQETADASALFFE